MPEQAEITETFVAPTNIEAKEKNVYRSPLRPYSGMGRIYPTSCGAIDKDDAVEIGYLVECGTVWQFCQFAILNGNIASHGGVS